MSTFPFYSHKIREELVAIIANHREEQVNSSPVSRVGTNNTDLRRGSAIRGKRVGGFASSSSSGDDANDAADVQHVDDAVSSSSSTSSSEESDEDRQGPGFADTARSSVGADITSLPQRTNGMGTRHSKKTKNKKSKDDLLQRMGRAPSVPLPSTSSRSDSRRKTLEIPSVLLPNNYLRDNPNWKVSLVAGSLLSTWKKLNGSPSPTILVVLLQSGRFACAVFTLQSSIKASTSIKMIAHKTSTRYTVRKGQGGSQANFDQSKHKAKSVGAQLRREGEKQLREDVCETWKEWRKLGYIERALWVYVSCPKGMKRHYLFGGKDGNSSDVGSSLIDKNDVRLKNIPLDVGRPTMEATTAVLDCVLSCCVREMTEDEIRGIVATNEDGAETGKRIEKEENCKEVPNEVKIYECPDDPPVPQSPPFTPLHNAVIDGDLQCLMKLLKVLDETGEQDATAQINDGGPIPTPCNYDVNTAGGPDHQTALHIAASSNHPNATSLLSALLTEGHANPCAVDARGRPPYFLASSDKHRETFRLARGSLGEKYCMWDDEAKVGPALTETEVQKKKAKALEKKRRQRARQKEKKAIEKAAAEKAAVQQREEKEKKKRVEDAKRIRDGLKPKTSSATNVCDFCQKVVKGKRRSQMFQRLEYAYCSTDCVRRHQRELMAAAATARMG